MSNVQNRNINKTAELTKTALMVAMNCISAYIIIPLPFSLSPVALQTLIVNLTGYVLNTKQAFMPMLVYLLVGLAGIPVFTGGTAGPGKLFGPTGGYIIGFLFSALVMSARQKLPGKKYVMQIVSMIVGLIVCYAFGTAWFMIVYSRANGAVGLATVLGWCVIPFIIPDIIKIVLAYGLSRKLRKFVA